MPAARYALTGLPIPVITPGNLRALGALMKAARQASLKTPGQTFKIKAVEGGVSAVIRLYQAGEDITAFEE